nr:NBS-LRR resistance-like protein [Tanacetum cinerariifolium]
MFLKQSRHNAYWFCTSSLKSIHFWRETLQEEKTLVDTVTRGVGGSRISLHDKVKSDKDCCQVNEDDHQETFCSKRDFIISLSNTLHISYL